MDKLEVDNGSSGKSSNSIEINSDGQNSVQNIDNSKSGMEKFGESLGSFGNADTQQGETGEKSSKVSNVRESIAEKKENPKKGFFARMAEKKGKRS